MHRRASLVLGVAFMVVSGAAAYLALDWPWKAKLFPLVIAVPVFCMALAEVVWTVLDPAARGEEREFKLSGQGTDRGMLRRTLLAVAWMIGFFAAIVLVGFQAAIPLLTLCYLKLQGRESWGLSIVFAIAISAAVYLVFDWLLHLPFPPGLLLGWLGLA